MKTYSGCDQTCHLATQTLEYKSSRCVKEQIFIIAFHIRLAFKERATYRSASRNLIEDAITISELFEASLQNSFTCDIAQTASSVVLRCRYTYLEVTRCKLGEDKYFCPKRAHPLAHAYMQLRSEDPLPLSVEKPHKAQSGAPHLKHGTSSDVSPLRVWAPVRAPRSSAEEWSPAEAEFTESRSRGFTTPLGQTRIERERESERALKQTPLQISAHFRTTSELTDHKNELFVIHTNVHFLLF